MASCGSGCCGAAPFALRGCAEILEGSTCVCSCESPDPSPEGRSRGEDPRRVVADPLREDEFWRKIPAYARMDAAEFQDHRFQIRHCVTSAAGLRETLGGLAGDDFLSDVDEGIRRSTMSVRLSPYIVSLIDWRDPYADPLRIQFLPVASRMLPDHPRAVLDALNEQTDSPVSGLTHRYQDRALFLTLDTCPEYCRCCTRSYAVGGDTGGMSKLHFRAQRTRWERAFEYIDSRPEVEDVVISGGDVANLGAEHIRQIGFRLLSMPHVLRLRFATKSPAVIPQKLVTDDAWVRALIDVVEQGRRLHKHVAVHTHFNHPNEITGITKLALDRLMEQGVTVRNQTVLQRGVNDRPEVLHRLIRRLSRINVQPYYIFVHDLVPGVEDLRTSLALAIELEKEVRGVTAGFNTPAFVVDMPGGGGKRDVHSYEYYDREHGISVFTSPLVKPGTPLFYFDPLHSLTPAAQKRWRDPAGSAELLEQARRAARRPGSPGSPLRGPA